MPEKIGGFIGLLSGFIVWNMIGGIGGFLVASFVVIPAVSALLIALLSAMGSREAAENSDSKKIEVVAKQKSAPESVQEPLCPPITPPKSSAAKPALNPSASQYKAITFVCSCGKRLQTKMENAGKRLKCPACAQGNIVPSIASSNPIQSQPAPTSAKTLTSPTPVPPPTIQSFSTEEVSRNAEELGEMYFDCPHCGHCERLNDVGKTLYKANPFQFKDYACLKCKKQFDAAPRMKFGICPTNASPTAATPNTLVAQVKFKKKWSQQNRLGLTDTYEEFSAPSEDAAKAYLNTRQITQAQYYVVVETPEGCWGKDRAGIYKE